MKEFLVGLLVILMTVLLSILGIFLFPLLLVLGFFLRWFVSVLLILFAVWLIGKVTLQLIGAIHKKEK